jgi:integrase
MRDAGHTLLFPCLRERGQRTPLSNLFYKDFFKLLAELLPSASEQRKSFHSLRKAGNTYMVNGNINDPIRHAVMGHAHSGANEAHYLDQVWDGTKLAALSHIPNVTAHLG